MALARRFLTRHTFIEAARLTASGRRCFTGIGTGGGPGKFTHPPPASRGNRVLRLPRELPRNFVRNSRIRLSTATSADPGGTPLASHRASVA
jgi:hypothetical protein